MEKAINFCFALILTLLLPFSQIVPIAASDDGVYVYGLEPNEIKNSKASEILVDLVNKKMRISNLQ